jgi:hypothetical protein
MTKNSQLTALALAFICAVTALSGAAMAYSDKVQDYCKGDYLNFCSVHPVGSTGMRRCMEANGKSLSSKCVNALVDAGEIPRKFKR